MSTRSLESPDGGPMDRVDESDKLEKPVLPYSERIIESLDKQNAYRDLHALYDDLLVIAERVSTWNFEVVDEGGEVIEEVREPGDEVVDEGDEIIEDPDEPSAEVVDEGGEVIEDALWTPLLTRSMRSTIGLIRRFVADNNDMSVLKAVLLQWQEKLYRAVERNALKDALK